MVLYDHMTTSDVRPTARTPRLAASVYTRLYIHVFDIALCTLANADHLSFSAAVSAFVLAWHDLAKMDASKQEATTLEGARGPTAQLKALNKESEYSASV